MASTSHPSRDCSQVIDHSHVPEFEVATWIKITLILVYLVIFVVGILGNSVTIRVTQVLQKKGYLQKEVTDHMVSLACSDILVFLIGMPMEFYSIIWNPLTTPSYTVSCKVHTFLFEACSYATLLHVLTLSFERYIAICHPFRYKAMSGPCQVKLLIGFVWVTSALVALPLLFAMGVEYPLVNVPSHWGLTCNRSRTHHQEQPESSNMSICTNLSSRWTVFQSSIFGAFVVYLVVLVSVAFMCWSMMQVLRRSKQGTLAAQGQQLQLRKLESQESRSARRQTIIFLMTCGLVFDQISEYCGLSGHTKLAVRENQTINIINSTPGLPVHHQLPEFTETHVHRVSDAIQPSHPRLSPSPPLISPSCRVQFAVLNPDDLR
ncbi:G-protein coupled receptor 39 isoform X2 [Bubalus kerabau]|uniref:G-protein coupled receptor 39 isoform X2 n=1 Tax=Bubalus carabanensis TaxID=3119969 RepID=UPI00244EB287|nr:G-protein coupled receptor 39 isoform X2 [Bubalus carabanensis]